MDVVLVACAVLLDVNACSGPCHPTTPYYLLLLYSTSIEDSRCWLRTANTLTYGPPHTVAKFPGVYARLKSVLREGRWLVSSLKLVVLRIRRRRDSAACEASTNSVLLLIGLIR